MEISADTERHSSWLENFYDLIVAIVIAQLSTIISHNMSLNGFRDFVILFIPVVWSWIGVTFYNTRFDTDDLGHRLLTLLQMAAAAFMAISIPSALSDNNSKVFAISYAVIRTLLVIEYIRTGHSAPATRPLALRYSIGFSIAAAFWFASVFFPPPFRFLLWVVGLVIDIATPMIFTLQLSTRFAPHVYHLPERFGSFTIIVLGIAILGFVDGIAAAEHDWSALSISDAAIGLGIAFSLWWVYFDSIDGSAIKAFRRDKRIGIYVTWLYIHFPLTIGFTAFGVSLEHVVLSDQHAALPLTESLLICGSVSLCLFSLGILQIVSSRGKAIERNHMLINNRENNNININNINNQILTQKSTATYTITAAIFVIFFPILGQSLLPIFTMIVVGIACICQVILDIKHHPHHRRFKL
jgi:low temperature requirement protein LtrA